MIHVLVLSNNVLTLEQLSKNLRRSTDDTLCIITTTDSREALSVIRSRQIYFDLFIIPVQLDDCSGYVLEKEIRKVNLYQFTPILFLTKNSYSLVGYDPLSTYQTYRLRNFIPIPLDDLDVQGKFCLYLDAIYANQLQIDQQNKKIRLKNQSGDRDIPIKNILYLEIQNKLCTIYSLNGKFILKRTSLSSVLQKINCLDLVRCHRFFAVNLKNVDYIEKKHARLWTLHFKASNLTCPVSNVYQQQINLRLHDLDR